MAYDRKPGEDGTHKAGGAELAQDRLQSRVTVSKLPDRLFSEGGGVFQGVDFEAFNRVRKSEGARETDKQEGNPKSFVPAELELLMKAQNQSIWLNSSDVRHLLCARRGCTGPWIGRRER